MWEGFDLALIVFAGLAMGSFTTALVYRLPRGIPFSQDAQGRPVRSMCPPCGRQLTSIELIPVLSWVLQRGKCKCGKTSISWHYPAIEIGILALTALMGRIQGVDLIDTPRYVALPFAAAVTWLSFQGRGWPRSVDGVLGATAFVITFIELVFHQKGVFGALPIFFAAPFIFHGARIPARVQEAVLPITGLGFLATLILF